ncbi:MAG: hypothetical protein D4R73_10670 [Deltaproteobacteria bacterium]|nr:MAG: hypothetical protein D4R73_10670 [Deltaproteobacteria bacterium]
MINAINQLVPLSSCSIEVNAIRVTTRQDENLNQPVITWVARVFANDTVDVTSRPSACIIRQF